MARPGRDPAPVKHTQVVAFDRFDEMTWTDVYTQARALRELADELADRHSYTTDLLRDLWTGAYKAVPRLHDLADMDPSRAVNHQVVSSLTESPAWKELRRNTVGDPYASAMAVLAQGSTLRNMLEQTCEAQKEAEEAQEAQRQAAEAAQQVQQAMEAAAAAADPDGQVPGDAEAQVAAAVAAAKAADQAAAEADADAQLALAKAGPGIRTAARAAAEQAADKVREDAELMAAWGVEPERLQRMSFAERADLARRLSGNRLAAYAQLIGRFRAMAAGERARRVEHTTGELVGVTVGDDLARLVPSELAALAVPALRADFAVRLAEGRLMVYESRDEEETGQGAIIALVDCSGSMTRRIDGSMALETGDVTREAWAKALSLALLDQARASGRDFVGILFSSKDQQQAFHFPKGRADLVDVLEFAEHFFSGLTDFQEPLGQAADILADQYNADGSRRGDIVLITDGSARVADEWMEQWRQRRDLLGFRVFGVSIAQRPTKVLEELCDNLRQVSDLLDLDVTRDMFRTI
ncbi:VWA domain-containing protein [Nonomuraea antimicrobica]